MRLMSSGVYRSASVELELRLQGHLLQEALLLELMELEQMVELLRVELLLHRLELLQELQLLQLLRLELQLSRAGEWRLQGRGCQAAARLGKAQSS